MGAWAQTTLDNDTAADFVGNASDDAGDWGMVADALGRMILMEEIWGGPHPDSVLEGLAAAEFVATALGRPTGSGFISSREALARWTKAHPLGQRSLIPTLARTAASMLPDDSSDVAVTTYPGADTSTWGQTFDNLRSRLACVPGDPGVGSEPPTPAEFASLWQELAEVSPDAALAMYKVVPSELRACISEDVFRPLMSGSSWRSSAARAAWAENHPGVNAKPAVRRK